MMNAEQEQNRDSSNQPCAWGNFARLHRPTNANTESQGRETENEERHVMDDLADNARIRQSNAPFLPDAPTNDQLDDAAAWVRDWMEAQDKSNSWLAKRIGKSSSTISQVLSGQYASDRTPVLRAVLDSIESFAKSTETLRPPDLVETQVVRRMMALIQHVVSSETMGVIDAPAGCSKTVVLRAAARMFPGAIYLRVRSSAATPAGFIAQLARKVGVSYRHRTADCVEAIIARLADSGRLILIDEAHNLSRDSFDAIRDIHDEAMVPIVFAGTDTPESGSRGLGSKIDDSRTGAQFLSRVPYRYKVTDALGLSGGGTSDDGERKRRRQPSAIFTVDEVMKICAGGKLRFADDAIDLLFRIANTPYLGCLRTCQRLVMQAAQHPKLRTRTIKSADLTRIMRVMQGETYTRFIETHADQMRHLSATATTAAAG